ncbi:MAG: hypothetical protein HY722_10570 [Planctomycetes bacterium]|nr:hypothetical protein [Planctomycetota bacterium]
MALCVAGGAAEMGPEGFRERLLAAMARLEAEAEDLRRGGPGDREAVLHTLRGLEGLRVRLEGGAVVEDPAWEVTVELSRLEASTEAPDLGQVAALVARLEGMAQEAGAVLRRPARRGDPRARVRDILSGVAYRRTELGRPDEALGAARGQVTYWDGIRAFFRQAWARLRDGGWSFPQWFQGLRWPRVPDLPRGAWQALLGCAVAAGVALVAWAAYRVASRAARRREGLAVDPGVLDPVEREVLLSEDPEAWRALARRLAARGDFRGAARACYLGALAALGRAGLVTYDPARTNWETLGALPVGLRGDMEPLTLDFDRVWYGRRPCGAPELGRFEDGAERVLRRLAGASAG